MAPNKGVDPSVPDPGALPLEKVPDLTKSTFSEQVSRLAITPYPAWGFSAALFSTLPRSYQIKTYLPRPLSCLGFGSIIGFAGYMSYDNDPINGAGVASAWSILYLLANGRRGITQFKPWPAVLSLYALGNAAMYGREFFFPDEGMLAL
ncbi:loss of respiratory capacity protein 2 [Myxozyma melibiosi]|uniref:Loss of respiratory capacity protein 2 n=1 Tax=Myxozyma melibiosi TaxID=54550 RepID=A0ABR1FEY7_9ASCO